MYEYIIYIIVYILVSLVRSLGVMEEVILGGRGGLLVAPKSKSLVSKLDIINISSSLAPFIISNIIVST